MCLTSCVSPRQWKVDLFIVDCDPEARPLLIVTQGEWRHHVYALCVSSTLRCSVWMVWELPVFHGPSTSNGDAISTIPVLGWWHVCTFCTAPWEPIPDDVQSAFNVSQQGSLECYLSIDSSAWTSRLSPWRHHPSDAMVNLGWHLKFSVKTCWDFFPSKRPLRIVGHHINTPFLYLHGKNVKLN